ncbi:hypothetical protein SJR52_15345 [Aeromonas caviae]|jgi:hypothetical protein|uniref:hypothetical protein n=1 Tax=Aeromonas caviae TaxID=648 RepID=UPI0029D9465D|nr:hypothetical protein [Aeromonas caviae]MDX7750865.1 hypothetical protein [Aeromonas caviae]
MKNLCVLFFSTVFLFGCGDSEENMMSGKFASIDSCLSSIKKNTQSTLDIVRNEPGDVSGFLSNGAHFGCKTKTTGTEGVYVEGWYSIKE